MNFTAVLLAVIASVPISGQQSRPIVSTPQTSAADFVLATGRAGRIELGTSVDEMYQLFGRDNVRLVDPFSEGQFSPALQVRLPGATVAPAVVTSIREWPCGGFSVWGIDVRDPRFRTKDGLGVGTTVGELRRLYAFRVTEAEGAHAAVIEALRMSFALSREEPLEQQRVVAVWIWPDPVAVRTKRCPERGEL